jgi:hypothetical protein
VSLETLVNTLLNAYHAVDLLKAKGAETSIILKCS